ncbi:aminopeptidase C [Peptoniphilus gorbachii]|uniref:Aminopeptidase n=1 Tax=Peptoniphilus gorbachii TaxID=411567 RepID=A0ABS2MHJ7_9FIRM|nr:C1 family peptidase [Peptoniphilus gorbachii]MBM7549478.1 bleomycin hydrolase [Peptoniphilus gorbachii]MDU6783679.1 C1 family peptidase [Peptoniphilus harei]
MEITKEFLQNSREKFYKDRANRVAQRAAVNNGLVEASVDRVEDERNRHTFNIELKEKEIRNQKQSGRCWMFAALNLMEYKLCRKYNLKGFELSKNYTLFFDKLERCNYFLDSIIRTLDEDLDGRLVSHILTDPMGDGGQWDMIKNIIKKYGLVPSYAMKESVNSSATANLNNYLTKILRMYAKNLRDSYKKEKDLEKLKKTQEEYMKKIYDVLSISLGTPPEKFDFEVRNEDEEFISDKNLTPQEFLKKHVEVNLDDYISLINAPTKDKPYFKSYTVDFLGNVMELDKVRYVNVPVEVMKDGILKQLKDGEPVWFGCDVAQFFYRKGANLDLSTLKIFDLLNVEYDLSKEERLDYKESLMTHAMVFVGCDYDEENKKINRYKVENSWGKDAGDRGYLVMSDEWFDEYMYQALINKKYLDEKVIKAYSEEPIHLKPWDPMGSLA